MSDLPTKAERVKAAEVVRLVMAHRAARDQRLMAAAEQDDDMDRANAHRICAELETAMGEKISSILKRDSLADDYMVG